MDYIGIDIGSTCAKVVVMDEDEKLRHQSVQSTGWSSVDTADIIKICFWKKVSHLKTERWLLPAMERCPCHMQIKR